MAAYSPGNISPHSGKRKVSGKLRALLQKLTFRRRRLGPAENRAVAGLQRQLQAKRFSRALVAVVVLFGGGGGALWILSSLAIHSDVFRLTDIKVRGNSKVDAEKIVSQGGLEQGASLPALNLDRSEQAIRSMPWIEKAAITRHWPSTIEITVREQKPLALVNVEVGQRNELLYINSKGEMFAALTLGQDFDYPVITGMRYPSSAEKSRVLKGDLEEAALYLLKLAARGNAILPIQAISEIYVGGDGLVVYLVDRPFPIYFGSDRIRTKYYRLVKILERLYRKKQMEGITAIRLDYTENKVLVARADIDR